MNEKDFAELAAGHALNALSPDDEQAFTLTLAEHPEWAHYASTDAAVVAALADGVAEVAPPTALRDSLLAMIAAQPQDSLIATSAVAEPSPAVAEPTSAVAEPTSAVAEPVEASAPELAAAAPRRAGFGARAWFALAASIALLVGVGAGTVFVAQQINRPAAVIALEQIESAPDAQSATSTLSDGGEATVHWSESVGQVVLVSDGLPTISDGESFELWFVRDGAPISAGVFAADASGQATALLSGTMAPGDIIAVTIEEEGGSPSGQPTTEPIVAITTA